MRYFSFLLAIICYLPTLNAQNIQDDFEGFGTITTWAGDDCNINTSLVNPFQQGINTSTKVLEYRDIGGQYANVRFDVSNNFNLSTDYTFSMKIYVPSSGLTGSQPNQVSLKLQNGTLGSPWVTQSEIIKPIVLNQWQTVTFDFLNDTYINLDPNSLPPTQRTDFNRVVIQMNGENNNNQVLAYFDDVEYNMVTTTPSQNIQDNFEGTGTITTWAGDACNININLANPQQQGINTSSTVLQYGDVGGQYANIRFDVGSNLDLSSKNTFSLKIYVPSSGLTGSQPNQVSLKLQDATLGSPWSTQSEVIKPIVLNQWQTVTFDFLNDIYINLDPNSLPPTQRTDFNRVLIQVNGENNSDHVLAYIDDINYDTSTYVPSPPTPPAAYILIWSDEFDVDGAVNTSNWHHQTQLPAGGNWYNGEVQHYTNRIDNSYVNNGTLKIVAKKETFTDQGYTKSHTSARLNSKFAFKYGKVEVRAKLLAGAGTWPAIWALGKNINEDGGYWDNQGYGTTSWPACGEIDIMEHWGNNQNYVQSAIHTPSSFGGTVNLGGQVVSTASSAFHIYTFEWTAEKLVFSVDGVVHYTYNPAVKDGNTWPFDAEQYLLLNIAIEPSIPANFIQGQMEIDYVRVYQQTPTPPAIGDSCLVIWTNLQQTTVKQGGKRLQKTTKNPDGWTGAAISQNSLDKNDNGWVQMEALRTDKRFVYGLAFNNTNPDKSSIRFGIELHTNSIAYVSENGYRLFTIGAYAIGDIFRIEKANGQIKYYQNGILVYTSNKNPWGDYYVDASIMSMNGIVYNAYASFICNTAPKVNPTPVVFEENSLLFEEITAYPNPFQNNFTIDYTNKVETIQSIELYDINGRYIRSIAISQDGKTSVDTADLTTGVYLVTIRAAGSVKHLKIIKTN